MKIDVWIIHKHKKVLVTDDPGVPVAVTWISPDAKDPNSPTISEVMFDKNCWKAFDEWSEASAYGQAKAKELGYEYDVSSRWY